MDNKIRHQAGIPQLLLPPKPLAHLGSGVRDELQIKFATGLGKVPTDSHSLKAGLNWNTGCFKAFMHEQKSLRQS